MLGWPPDNVSPDALFRSLYWTSTIAMVIAQLALARSVRTGTRAREIVWAVVPMLLLLSFGTASYRAVSARATSDIEQSSRTSAVLVGERQGR